MTTITPEKIAVFITWLAAPPWQTDKVAIGMMLKPTAEQVTMLYGGRKALQILEKLSAKSDTRAADIATCVALFDRMLGQCAYENRPKPDAEVDVSREDLPTLGRAAIYLIEFQLRKQIEDADEKRFKANRGTYRGSR